MVAIKDRNLKDRSHPRRRCNHGSARSIEGAIPQIIVSAPMTRVRRLFCTSIERRSPARARISARISKSVGRPVVGQAEKIFSFPTVTLAVALRVSTISLDAFANDCQSISL